MIVLRKISPGQSIELGATLSGVLNDSNKVFTTEFDYTSGSITIDYNGQTLHSPTDFTETASNEVTFVYITPKVDASLKATYEKLLT